MRIVLLLALAALAACDGLLGPGIPAAAFVRVVDQEGDALRPDEVKWYYDPQGERYDGEHPAVCIDRLCTVWGVPEEVTGTAYVSATRVREYPGDPWCAYVGYDAGPVAASKDDPPTITLEIDTEMVMCQ